MSNRNAFVPFRKFFTMANMGPNLSVISELLQNYKIKCTCVAMLPLFYAQIMIGNLIIYLINNMLNIHIKTCTSKNIIKKQNINGTHLL